MPRLRCPMCAGERACLECDGLGDLPCPACLGKGHACRECEGTGRLTCTPCDGSGACPRCRGEGEIEQG